MRRRHRLLAAALPACALLLTALPAAAQTVRLSGVTTVRYVAARAIREDSVPIERTTGTGLLRYTADSVAVRCLDPVSACRYLAPGEVLRAVPLSQDLSVAAWGLGTGVRFQAQLRLRPGALGDEGLWPRADDRFEALEAYLEVHRGPARVRLGRQWQASGLGAYSFDGGGLQLRRGRAVLDVYGGWSLVRGLAEPVSSAALAALEPFAPDARAILLGSKLQLRASSALGGSIAYQREIRSDRLGLYSERAAADAFYRHSHFTLEGAADADLATRALNHLRLAARLRPLPAAELDLFARHYRPYFDLWTIWGAFTPTGFNEAGAVASLDRPDWPLAVGLELSRRAYHETDGDLVFAPQRRTGWRVGASAAPRLPAPWSAQARYGADVGFGAARTEVALRLRRAFGSGHVGLEGTAFERASDYRVSDGVVVGGGLDAAVPLNARTRASAQLLAYRHLGASASAGADWTQTRALLQLEWTLGPEPGRRAGGGR